MSPVPARVKVLAQGEAVNVGLRRFAPGAVFNIGLWLFYFAILTVVALPEGLNTSLRGGGLGSAGIKVLSSIAELKAIFGGCDAGSYIIGAEDILAHGFWGSYWYYNLWAPGFFWLQAIGMALFGASLKIGLYLCVLNALCWSATFWLIYYVCKQNCSQWLAALLPCLMFAFPFFRDYFLTGEGVFMTEPMSASLYTVGALLLLLSVTAANRWVLLAAGAGFALAVCVYLRAAMELVVNVSTLTFALWACGAGIKNLLWRRKGKLKPSLVRKNVFVIQLKIWAIGARLKWFLRKPKQQLFESKVKPLPSIWKSVLLCLVVFHCLTFPWRLHNLHYRGDMQWIRIDYYWKNLFMRNEDFLPSNQWYVTGGAPVACYCNLKLCDAIRAVRQKQGDDAYSAKEYQVAAVKLFLRHPIKWIAYKLEHLPPYWFSQPTVTVPYKFDPSNLIIVFLSVAGLLLSIKTLKSSSGKLLIWLFVSFCLAQCLSCAFLHFEVRYFYGIKTFMIIFAMLEAVLFFAQRRTKPLADIEQRMAHKDVVAV